LFLTALARLGLTGAYAQVSVGWKEIYASGGAFSGYLDSNAFAQQTFGRGIFLSGWSPVGFTILVFFGIKRKTKSIGQAGQAKRPFMDGHKLRKASEIYIGINDKTNMLPHCKVLVYFFLCFCILYGELSLLPGNPGNITVKNLDDIHGRHY